MTIGVQAALVAGSFLCTLWLTGRFRRYALARRLIDVPNERSSHVVSTPRGGGTAIAVTVIATLPVLGLIGALSWPVVVGLSGGGAAVALIGFIDDKGVALGASWRLLIHFAAAFWMLAWFGDVPGVMFLGVKLSSGWIGIALMSVFVAWLINLTNFMDGIDGIASVEAITVCVGAMTLYLLTVPETTAWLAPAVLASAILGFLCWNWPPAKIFMGDAGSGFLGLMMGGLALQGGIEAPPLFWGWVVLLGVFVVDATMTLLGRVARGEKFYEAHRSHAYQRAAQRWGTHRGVTLAVAAINVGWLFPIAWLVARGTLAGLAGVLIAYVPIAAAVAWLRSAR